MEGSSSPVQTPLSESSNRQILSTIAASISTAEERDPKAIQSELQTQVEQARANRERVAQLREQLRQFQQVTAENAREIKQLRSERFHALQSDDFFAESSTTQDGARLRANLQFQHESTPKNLRAHDALHLDSKETSPNTLGQDIQFAIGAAKHEKQDPSKEEWSDADSDVDMIVHKRRLWEEELLDEGAEQGKVVVIKPYKSAIFDPDSMSDMVDGKKSFPTIAMELQHVHGYSGLDRHNNILWSASRELIYVAGSVAVVANLDEPSKIVQRFFMEHKHEIGSICLHPDGMTVASGDLAADPKIFIWSADRASMEHGKSQCCLKGCQTRGVVALCFSKDGRYLVSVGDDSQHKIAVYDWKAEQPIAEAAAGENIVFSIKCSPHDGSYVSVGVHHIMFWSLVVISGHENLPGSVPITVWKKKLLGKRGVFGRHGLGRSRTLLCVDFGAPGVSITGVKDGTIMIWKGSILISYVQAHSGPVISLCVAEGDGIARVVSGSKRGEYCVWFLDTSLHPAGPAMQVGKDAGCVRALACHDSSDTLAIGTSSCALYVVALLDALTGPVPITLGHFQGAIRALCAHPLQNIYLSGGDDRCLRLWNFETGGLEAKCTLPYPITCIGYSPDGLKIAVGMETHGGLMVSQPDLNTLKVVTTLNFGSKWRVPVTVVKFSPDGEYLAVGSARERIDVYRGVALKQRLGICKGHRGTITHLDWSADSKFIASTSSSYELFFWDRSTFQVIPAAKASNLFEQRQGQAKSGWHSWTCNLGWPVQGMVLALQDESELTSVQLTADRAHIFGAYKSGEIKVFRHPCLDPAAKCVVSRQHVGCVCAIQLLRHSNVLISAGASDLCIFQWNLIPFSSNSILDSTQISNERHSDSDAVLVRLIKSMSDRASESTIIETKLDQFGIAKPFQSSIYPPSMSTEQFSNERISWNLVLEQVHGSNLPSTKGNILLLKSGAICYATGRFCIVQSDPPIQPRKVQKHMTSHTSLVTALALHRDGVIVASGQDGPNARVFVWRSDHIDILASFENSTFGIASLMFNLDGEYLITVSNDSGIPVSLWRWKIPEIVNVEYGEESGKNVVLASRLNPGSQEDCELFVTVGIRHAKFWTKHADGRLGVKTGRSAALSDTKPVLISVEFGFSSQGSSLTMTGTEFGEIWLWSGTKHIKSFKAHSGPVYELCTNYHLNYLCSASNDGFLRFWNSNLESVLTDVSLRDPTFSLISNPVLGEVGIISLQWNQDLDRLLIGTSAGDICSFSFRDGMLYDLSLHSNGSSEKSLRGVAIHPSRNMMAIIGGDKTLKIWHVDGGHDMVGMVFVPSCGTALDFSRNGSNICIALENGILYILETAKLQKMVLFDECISDVQPKVKRKNRVTCLKFSPQDIYLAAGSSSGEIDIFKVSSDYELIGTCSGNTSAVNALDWNCADNVLQSTTLGDELHFWRLPDCNRIVQASTVRDEEWATWKCRIGWPVLGAMPEEDGSLLRCVSRQNTKPYFTFAAGYDGGIVKIYPYPCADASPSLKTYDTGLSAVDFVSYTYDNNFLIAVSFSDIAIQVWRNIRFRVMQDDADIRLILEKPLSKITVRSKQEFEAIDAVKPYKSALYEPPHAKHSDVKSNIHKMHLEFIFSYRGYDCRKNVFLLKSKEILYNSSGLVVIHRLDNEEQSQRFFDQHFGDVISLAVHPDGEIVASGEIGVNPIIHVWNSTSLKSICRLSSDQAQDSYDIDGFANLCFGGIENEFVIAISNISARMNVFNWRKQVQLVTSSIGCKNILALACNPYNQEFVCCGIDHISFWTIQGKNKLHGIPGVPGKLAIVQTHSCVEFVCRGSIYFTLTGSVSGCIFVWVGVEAIQMIEAHSGPVMDILVLQVSYGGLPGSEEVLCSGCKDGSIRLWEICDIFGTNLELKERDELLITEISSAKNVSIRSLSGSADEILIGTSFGEIFRTAISAKKLNEPRALVRSHQTGDVPFVVVHPLIERLVFSAGEDRTLRVWDVGSRCARCVVSLCDSATALDISPNGRLISAGLSNGSIEVWKIDAATAFHDHALQAYASCASRSGVVRVLRFFKDPRMDFEDYLLAAGTDQGRINIYSTTDPLTCLGTCRGHSGRIIAIDADVEGNILQSNSSTFELFFWRIKDRGSGKVACEAIHATEAQEFKCADWTCMFGWPVHHALGKASNQNDHSIFCSDDDIVSLHGSLNSGLCVATDANCTAGLLPFPVSAELPHKVLDRAVLKSKMSCVRFCGSKTFVSADCKYGSLMLWQIVEDTPEEAPCEAPSAPRPSADHCFRAVSGRLTLPGGLSCDVQPLEAVKPPAPVANIDIFRRSFKAPRGWSSAVHDRLPPENKLALTYVHGFRGMDDNSNIHILDNELLYYTSCFCIVANFQSERRTQRIFDGHCRDNEPHWVTSAAVHPNKLTVASGDSGVTPCIFIWNSRTLEVEACIRGPHRNAIASLCFSSNGTLLVSVAAEEESSVFVHDWKNGTLMYESPREGIRKILILKANPFSGTIVTCGVNHVNFWKLQGTGRNVGRVFGLMEQPQTILCVAFPESNAEEGLTLTAGELGAIYIWKDRAKLVTGANIRPISCIVAHEGPIYDLFCDSSGVFSCGKGGWIKLWKIYERSERDFSMKCQESHQLLVEICNVLLSCPLCSDCLCIRSMVRVPWDSRSSGFIVGLSSNSICEINFRDNSARVLVQGHGKGKISCLSTHPSSGLFATGGDDKNIILWSKEERRAIAIRSLDSEPYAVEFTPDGGSLLVGLSDGQLLIFSSKLLNPLLSPFPPDLASKAITGIRFSPRGSLLAISNMAGRIYVFLTYWTGSICSYQQKATCDIHAGSILRMDWSLDCKYLQVETDRNDLIVWELDSDPATRFLRTEDHPEIPWATKTCVLGWHTQGFMQYTKSLTKICGDRSSRMDVLAAGDSEGRVILFRNPCPEVMAGANLYCGHAGGVAAVRFTCDDKNVLSVGLADSCIVLWQHVIVPQNEYDSDVDAMLNCPVVKETLVPDAESFPGTKPYLSSLVPPSLEPPQHLNQPNHYLQMEHIFGCNQTHRKLEVLKSGEILYLAGAVAVLFDTVNGHQRFYTEHTKPISTVDVDQSKEIVLTAQAQEESLIQVWSSKNLASLAKISCPFPVRIACFTTDGAKVVVLGQHRVNTIAVYDWKTKAKLAAEDFESHATLGMACHPEGEVVVTCGANDEGGNGCVAFWSLKRGHWQKKDGIFGNVGRPSTMMCIAFTNDTTRFTLTASQHGCIYLWKMQMLHKMIVGHRGPIFDLKTDHARLFSCGKDGVVKIWDSDWTDSVRLDIAELTLGMRDAGSERNLSVHSMAISGSFGQGTDHSRLIISLKSNEIFELTFPQSICDKATIQQIRLISKGHADGTLLCVCAHPYEQQFATSGGDKTLQIWDCVLCRTVATVRLPEVSHAIVYSADGRLITSGLSSGMLITVDPANPLSYEILSGKTNGRAVTCLKYSPSGRYLAVGNSHGVIKVLDAQNNFAAISKCRNPTESCVIHMDWSTNESFIQSNTRSFELHYWEVQSGQRMNRLTQLRDQTWATWSCTMGWYVNGIRNDVSEINCAVKARDLNIIAVGDTLGKVTLHRFPFSSRDALGRSYSGHSQVLDACFTCGDARLITIGTDSIAIQWIINESDFDQKLAVDPYTEGQDSGPMSIGKIAIVLRGVDRDAWISETRREAALIDAVMSITNIDKKRLSISRALVANDILIRLRFQSSAVDKCVASLYSDLLKVDSLLRSLRVAEIIMNERVFDTINKCCIARGRPIVRESLAHVSEIGSEGCLLPYAGTLIAPSEASQQEFTQAPHEELDIEHVHGYRGGDRAGGVFSLESGGVLFVMGRIAIIHDTGLNKQFFFTKHNEEISCISLHPCGKLITTSDIAQNPTIFVWSAETMEVFSSWSPHDTGPIKSMTFFKQDQLFSVSGPLDHTLFVLHDWKRRVSLCSVKGDSTSVQLVKWNHLDDEGCTVSCGLNHLRLWNLKSGVARSSGAKLDLHRSAMKNTTCLCLAFPTNVLTVVGTDQGSILFLRRNYLIRVIERVHEGAVFDIWAWGSQIFSGGEDGYVHRWRLDMESTDIVLTYLKSNDVSVADEILCSAIRSVESLDWCRPSIKAVSYCRSWSEPKSAPYILVGTENNCIYEIDEVSDHVRCVIHGHADGRVTGLSTHPTDPNVFATCGEDGMVNIWQCEERSRTRSRMFNQQLTCLQFSVDGGHLAVGSLRGSLYVMDPSTLCDITTGQTTLKSSQIMDVKYSPNNRFLAVALHCRSLQIFEVDDGYSSRAILRGHLFPLKNLDWDQSSRFIRTTSSGCELIFWDCTSKTRVRDLGQVRDLNWQTYHCTLGWHVKGLLPDNSTDHDITAVDRSNINLLAVTGWHGRISVFRFPCSVIGQGVKQYSVHSDWVSYARFTCDSARLISAGGHDGAVVQWRVLDEHPDPDLVLAPRELLPASTGGVTNENEKSDASHLLPWNRKQASNRAAKQIDKEQIEEQCLPTNGNLPKPRHTTFRSVSVDSEHRQYKPSLRNLRAAGDSQNGMNRFGARLELHHVHGQGGRDSRRCLWTSGHGQVVYSIGSVCVKRDLRRQSELEFFLLHANHVSCMALHVDGHHAATGEAGMQPAVYIWECRCMQPLHRLDGSGLKGIGPFTNNISSLAFCHDKLLIASGIVDNSLYLFNWKTGRPLAFVNNMLGRISACCGFCAAYSNPFEWVTAGSDDIRFWKVKGAALEAHPCVWGRPATPRRLVVLGGLLAVDTVAVPYLASSTTRPVTLAAGTDGRVYVIGKALGPVFANEVIGTSSSTPCQNGVGTQEWRADVLAVSVAAHDGAVTDLRCARPGGRRCDRGVYVVTGGKGGLVKLWIAVGRLHENDKSRWYVSLEELCQVPTSLLTWVPSGESTSLYKPVKFHANEVVSQSIDMVTSVCFEESSEDPSGRKPSKCSILIGTGRGDIWEVVFDVAEYEKVDHIRDDREHSQILLSYRSVSMGGGGGTDADTRRKGDFGGLVAHPFKQAVLPSTFLWVVCC